MDKLRTQFAIEIGFRYFPLHPATPDEGLTLEQLFAGRNLDIQAAQARMAALMAEVGLPYGVRTRTYNSRLAQEVAKWAESQSLGDKIHEALFHAYFVDNINLAKVDNLLAIVDQVGLSVDRARQVLLEREFRKAVDADWQRSRELGITGVPTFVINNRGLVGAQPSEQLVAFVVAAGAERRPT